MNAPTSVEHTPSLARPEDIKFGVIDRFFLMLSKTDVFAAWFVGSPESVMTQKAIGAMVLSTGIFAFMSMFFALSTTLLADKPWQAAAFGALFYGAAIIVMDREIVGSRSKATAFIRFPFAVVLGIALSYPMELKIFEKAINEQIERDIDTVAAKKVAEIEEIKAWQHNSAASSAAKADAAINQANQQIELLAKQAAVEGSAENGRCGTKCQGLWAQHKTAVEARDKLQEKQTTDRAAAMQTEEYKHKQQTLEAIEAELKKMRADASSDFLQRSRALENIVEGKNLPEGVEKSTSAFSIVWGLKIFFILFEVFPVMIKLFLEKNEYHAYLEARTALAKQKINCYTNLQLGLIRAADREGMEKLHNVEISDSLERLAEDPSYRTHPTPILDIIAARIKGIFGRS